MDMKRTASDSGTTRLRTLIRLVLLFGIAGVLAELVLIEHTESRTMWIPLVTLGFGALAVVLRLARPTRGTDRLMMIVMSAFVVSGVLGVWFHFDGNRQFELEVYPTMEGSELFWESLSGATPALAPGTMVLLGLIGLVATVGAPLSNREAS